ncbi:MAG: DUF4397 domain-containing protein [Candidatus Eremiobacteraeota bacterium]|nr:DUF4397 domain-containing protein [Candidatus Eremiobacteraeota bacterium]MBV8364973.1 DUF4397 domain-containing protein [Candidatus Eremiobacteraeota bacterium]
MPGTGPNPQTISFPGGSARVEFVQGSPNLNLGISTVDVYIDNKLAFPGVPYGASTPFIELPIGAHDFKLVQAGTLNPVFLDQVVTLKANTKYAMVAEGDAGFHTTTLGVFILPTYATANGSIAISYLNASPKAGTTDFWYNCPTPGPACRQELTNAAGVTVGSPAASPTSWVNNKILFPSTNNEYCFAAYFHGTTTLVPGGVNQPDPPGSDPQNAQCPSPGVNAAPGINADFILIDAPSVPPLVPPGGPSSLVILADPNG